MIRDKPRPPKKDFEFSSSAMVSLVKRREIRSSTHQSKEEQGPWPTEAVHDWNRPNLTFQHGSHILGKRREGEERGKEEEKNQV